MADKFIVLKTKPYKGSAIDTATAKTLRRFRTFARFSGNGAGVINAE